MSKEEMKLILKVITFWFKRKWSIFTTPKGEPSLDDFHKFVRKAQTLDLEEGA